ncbi:unnamed protein product [Amoebophrya sp. A25]|nr:unnamed protein product [Amoebophrya sp. A25]|eukprot:GSA25T00019939001.1
MVQVSFQFISGGHLRLRWLLPQKQQVNWKRNDRNTDWRRKWIRYRNSKAEPSVNVDEDSGMVKDGYGAEAVIMMQMMLKNDGKDEALRTHLVSTVLRFIKVNPDDVVHNGQEVADKFEKYFFGKNGDEITGFFQKVRPYLDPNSFRWISL